MNLVNALQGQSVSCSFNQGLAHKPLVAINGQQADAYFGSSKVEESQGKGGIFRFFNSFFNLCSKSSVEEKEAPYVPANRIERQAILKTIYQEALEKENNRGKYGFATVTSIQDEKALILSVWHDSDLYIYDIDNDQWYSTENLEKDAVYAYPGLDVVRKTHKATNHQAAEEAFEATLINMYEIDCEESDESTTD